MDVYATSFASFLPNAPVDNDAMEGILGRVHGLASRTRRIILKSNGIRRRHYAIDPVTGEPTHTNAGLTAAAVRRLAPYPGFTPGDIACLACGSSTPDQLLPGHASMVHGELGAARGCEISSTGGVCISGMAAFKYAWMDVALGLVPNAVATGSELTSSFLRHRLCEGPTAARAAMVEEDHRLLFDADFLRWMLSDGAGAVFLTPTRPADRLALRVDWIEIRSFADELEACMYAGAVKRPDGGLTGWRELSPERLFTEAALLIKQDVKLLNREVVLTAVDRTLPALIAKHGLTPAAVDWFLPHYSSLYFRQPIADRLAAIGFPIPFERWYTNLEEVGNIGSASIYLILEALLAQGRVRPGHRLLCFIPESGRFSQCYMHLTAV
jgi:3-oxoacyl-[acyl-carrier-protein] synthase-3